MKRLSLKKIAVGLVFIVPLLVVLLQRDPLRAASDVQIVYKTPGITSNLKVGANYVTSGLQMESPEKRSLITQDTSSVDILNRPIIGNGFGPLWVDGVNMNPDSWYWQQDGYGIKDALEGIDYYAKKEVYNTNNELVGKVGPDKMVTIAGAPQWMTTSTKSPNVTNAGPDSGSTAAARIWMTCNPTMFTPNPDRALPAFSYYQQYWEIFRDAQAQLPPGTHNACTNSLSAFGNQAFYQQYVSVNTSAGLYEITGYKDSVADDPSVRQCQIGRGYVPFVSHGDWPPVFGGTYTTDSAKYTANPYRCSWGTTISKIDPWHIADYAYMAQKVAERHGGDYYRIFTNMEAYRDQTTGAYDSAGYMAMWNAVYSGIKQVKPNAKIAGPGVLMRSFNDPNQTENAETLAECKGTWGVFDKRSTDAIRYWLSNKAGGSSIEVTLQLTDASGGNIMVTKSNDPAYREFQIKERVSAVKACIDAVQREVDPESTTLLPVSIGNLQGVANYGNTNLSSERQNAIYANTLGEIVNNGFDYAMFPDVAYISLQNGAIYDMLKGVRDTFGGEGYGFERESTTLFSPQFDEQKLGVFASKKGIMYVNKTNQNEPISTNGCLDTLASYQVKFTPLQDCNKPSTPPNFTALLTGRDVVLNWGESTDVESLIKSYNVYRKVGSGAFEKIQTLDANARTFTDSYTGTDDVNYVYQVTAVDDFDNESDKSTQSNVEIIVTTLQDVNLSCTIIVPANNSCTMTAPQYCQSGLSIQPIHGTSVISSGQITYTTNGSSTAEENYAHVRQRGDETANCNVNIKFVNDEVGENLQDINVSCTVVYPANNGCSVTAPSYCQTALATQPVHGTSTIADGKITYTRTGTSTTEENYAHVRQKDDQTAKCNVSVKFVSDEPDTDDDNNNTNDPNKPDTGRNNNLTISSPKTGLNLDSLKFIVPVALIVIVAVGVATHKKRSGGSVK